MHMRDVGESIRAARDAAGYTQLELARLAGTNQATISGIERGVKDARLSTLERIATALNGTVSFVPRRSASRTNRSLDETRPDLSLRERYAISDDDDDEDRP